MTTATGRQDGEWIDLDGAQRHGPTLEWLARMQNVKAEELWRRDVEVRAAVNDAAYPFEFGLDMVLNTTVDWVIEHYLEAGTVNLLYGPKDTYKSFVAVSMGMSVAAGLPWFGHAVQPGPFAYIAGEGYGGVVRRMFAWAIRHGQDLKTLPVARSTKPTQVLNDAVIGQWVEHVAVIRDRYKQPPALIIIDTLATNFGPGNQNDPSDMSRFVANVKYHLVGTFGSAVLIVHHEGKDGARGARGGSSIEADVDNVFKLKRTSDVERRVELACKHVKDGDKPPALQLQGRVVDLGVMSAEGEPLTSLVLDAALTGRQKAILDRRRRGESLREIAHVLGVSHVLVDRELRRIESMGFDTSEGVNSSTPGDLPQSVNSTEAETGANPHED